MAEDCDNTNVDRPTADNLTADNLVEEHLDAVYRYAYRLTGTVPDAEDLTQQVFLLAQQKRGQLREPGRARAWLYAILRNAFLRMVERAGPVSATSLGLDFDSLPSPQADAAADGDAVQAAMNDLPVEFRVAVAMFYFEDCSYREIAEKLGLPIGTVMSRLARAKKHLRARLASADGEAEATRPMATQ